MPSFDPFSLDRTLAGYARLRTRFVAALRTGGFVEHAFELLPAGLTPGLLSQLAEAAPGDPFAAAAHRWLGELLVQHAGVATAGAAARAYRLERVRLETPERGHFTPAELVHRALADGPRRGAWLAALAHSGDELAARRRADVELAVEQRRELGLPVTSTAGYTDTLDTAAGELELALGDAYGELRLGDFSELVALGLGTDVPGSWPAALTPRKLADWFREARLLDGLSPEVSSLPRALGAASALRGLRELGRAVHDAGAAGRRPFVLANDPAGLRARSYGALFALLPLHASFAERRLEIGRGRLDDYRRALARVVLLGAWLARARARLARTSAEGPAAYGRVFREWLPELLGFELDPRLAFVLLFDPNAEVELAATFVAAARDRALTERHDEDWFRNPRGVEELRGELESPPEPAADAALLAEGARTLAATLLAAC